MTLLMANNSYLTSTKLTDNYPFCEVTQYSKSSYKIREGLHARILHSMRDVQRLVRKHCTCCCQIASNRVV
jgi:hypothetical protein